MLFEVKFLEAKYKKIKPGFDFDHKVFLKYF